MAAWGGHVAKDEMGCAVGPDDDCGFNSHGDGDHGDWPLTLRTAR